MGYIVHFNIYQEILTSGRFGKGASIPGLDGIGPSVGWPSFKNRRSSLGRTNPWSGGGVNSISIHKTNHLIIFMFTARIFVSEGVLSEAINPGVTRLVFFLFSDIRGSCADHLRHPHPTVAPQHVLYKFRLVVSISVRRGKQSITNGGRRKLKKIIQAL